MNYPLRKKKNDNPRDYIYRGYDIEVIRTYNFARGSSYCLYSEYWNYDFNIMAQSPKKLKAMMDRRINKLKGEK